MSASVYTLNKGINSPIVFKGLKAPYIWWLGGGVLFLFLLFALLYVTGVPPFICLGIAGIAGAGVFRSVYRLSRRYGPHGLLKKIARQRIPKTIRCTSRTLFY